MQPRSSNEKLNRAILESVENGLYPGDENVLSAELPSSALKSLEELLASARQEVEVIDQNPRCMRRTMSNKPKVKHSGAESAQRARH